RDAERIRAKTNFPNFEIVANLKEATGEYVLFLDPDLEPLDENWLSAMGEQLSNPRIGAVGARIVSSDDAIESAGLILSPNGRVGSAFAGYPRNFRGANRQLQAVRNYSAVSASCLLTRREVLEKTASGNAMGSLDFVRDDRVCVGTEFCLNLREHGLRTVSIPRSEEHTSELQSPYDLVCRLLLEKKKKKNNKILKSNIQSSTTASRYASSKHSSTYPPTPPSSILRSPTAITISLHHTYSHSG